MSIFGNKKETYTCKCCHSEINPKDIGGTHPSEEKPYFTKKGNTYSFPADNIAYTYNSSYAQPVAADPEPEKKQGTGRVYTLLNLKGKEFYGFSEVSDLLGSVLDAVVDIEDSGLTVLSVNIKYNDTTDNHGEFYGTVGATLLYE